MATVTIKIASAGTPLSDGKKSIAGHVWYSLDNGQSDPLSYGFTSQNGKAIDTGDSVKNDNNLSHASKITKIGRMALCKQLNLCDLIFGPRPF
ncbi:MAG: hypothetical protein LBP33_03815 [Candidatus Adiutrix sp.]|jgi:hypothetical protein|nr:hypothetical protein [Candidatus Adiutrix sp.]